MGRKKKEPAEPKAPRPVGRPTKYTPELSAKIIDAIATSTKGLRRLCNEREDFPDVDQICKWLWKYPEFHEHYLRAKAQQQVLLAEEIVQISDDGSNDTYEEEGRDGKTYTRTDYDVIKRSELRVKTRQWTMERLAPKIYRPVEKTEVTHSFEKLSDEELLDKAREILCLKAD